MFKITNKYELLSENFSEKNKMFIKILYVYMISMNIMSLFYTQAFNDLTTNNIVIKYTFYQLFLNYIYNGFNTVGTLYLMIYNEKINKKLSIRKSFLVKLFFTNKICNDFINLVYLTPDSFLYSKNLISIYFSLTALNSIFYFYTLGCTMIVLSSKNYFKILLIVYCLSIINSFFLNYQSEIGNTNFFIILYYEISKLIIYIYLFLLNYFQNKFFNNFEKFLEEVKNLENLNEFIFSNMQSSKEFGIVIMNKGEKIFSNELFFDNLISHETLINTKYNSGLKNQINPNEIITGNNYNLENEMSRIVKNKGPGDSYPNSPMMSQDLKINKINSFRSNSYLTVSRATDQIKNPPKRNNSTNSILRFITKDIGLDDIKEENNEADFSIAGNIINKNNAYSQNFKYKSDIVKNCKSIYNNWGSFKGQKKQNFDPNKKLSLKTYHPSVKNINKINCDYSLQSSISSDSNQSIVEVEKDFVNIFKNESNSSDRTIQKSPFWRHNNFEINDSEIRLNRHIATIGRDSIMQKKSNIANKANLIFNHRDQKLNSMKNQYPDKMKSELILNLDLQKNMHRCSIRNPKIVVNKNFNINIFKNYSSDKKLDKQSTEKCKQMSHKIINGYKNLNHLSLIANDQESFNEFCISNNQIFNNFENLNFFSKAAINIYFKNNTNYNDLPITLIIYTLNSEITSKFNEKIKDLITKAKYGMILSIFLKNIVENIESDSEIDLGHYILKIGELNQNFLQFSQINQFTINPRFSISMKRLNEDKHFIIIKAINYHNSVNSNEFPLSKINPTIGLNNNENDNLPKNLSAFKSPIRKSIMSTDNKFLNNAKISALIHDFKHVSMDSYLFTEYLMEKYNVNADKDEILYMKFTNDYFNSLLLNITSYMKDSEKFFVGSAIENSQLVDIIYIVEMMIKIFNRRQNWENYSLEKNGNLNYRKNLKIYNRIIDKDNPNYKKVFSNKNYLISLFYNILSNAYKHTKEGEIVIETCAINYKEICVKIIDSGEGVPENILRNWTKPFNNDPINNNDNTSSGLGQFIIDSIAKNLKLNIPVPERNPSGKGTVFKIFIPIGNNSSNTVNNDHSYKNSSQLTKIFYCDSPIFLNIKDREELNQNDNDYFSELQIASFSPIKIILFDDDIIILNSFVFKLRANLQKNFPGYEFEFKACHNFQIFYDEFHKQLLDKSAFDFFILDQNLSMNMTGIEIAEMVDFTYKAYFEQNYEELFFNFIFVTEQADYLKYQFKNKRNKLFKIDQVFGKTEQEEISINIMKIISNRNI